MRKFKLFLSLLMLMAFSLGNVWAAEELKATLDFTDSGWGIPTSGTNTTEKSFTRGDFTIKLYSTTNYKQNSGYLILGKSGSTLTLPAFTWKTTRIEVVGHSGASGSVGQNIFVGNTAVSTATVGANGVTNSYDINANYQAAGNIYVFKVTTAHNTQIDKVLVYGEASASCSTEVTITPGSTTHGTFSLSDTKVCGDGEGGEISVTDISADDGYAFDEITTTNGTVDNENKKVTGITANTTITVLFKELQKYTVSFNTGAGNPSQADITETTAGAGITLPAGPTPACSADGWTFAGWSAEAVASETTSAPKLLSGNYKPTDNVTLFAVYKRTEGGSGAGAEIGATLFNEEFNGLSASDQPTAPSEGATVYGSASVSYTCESTYAKIYAESSAGGASPEMLIPRSDRNGYFEISNIPTGAASALTLTYRTNQSGLSVTSSTDGISIGNATGSNPYSRTITINQEKKPASFDLKFAMTTSSNGRLDNISIIVETSSAAGTTYYLSAPSCCEKHNVNIALGIQYGKVEADLTEACEGTEVTLTATPDEHCRFVKWDVKQGETPVAVSDNKFTMPAGNVTVSATFEEIRNTVNIINPGHGDITVTGADDLDAVLEGTELNVEVSGAGYEFTLKAYKVGDELTTVQITDGKLTMPAYGIVITADEQELVSPTILVSKDLIDFGKAVKGGAAPAFETFTISGANLTGDLSLAWDSDDAYFAWEVTEGSLAANAGIVEATIRVNVTAKGMSVAATHMDNLMVSGGGATQKEVIVGVEVQQTYTAKWFVNGEELTESTQTAVAGTDLIAPSNPTELSDDCDDVIFKGWAEAPIEVIQDDAPTYTTKTKMPEDNVNFYAVFASEVPGKDVTIQDHITPAVVGEPSNYTDWTGKTATSSAVYAGTSTGGSSYIQIRSNDAKSGVVSTTSGGKVTKITVAWNSSTANGRTLDVYGKNTAYESSADLYTEDEGNKIGSIVYGTSTELTISDDYAYIGFRSNASAMYLDEVVIDWKVPGEVTYSNFLTTCPSCNEVTFVKAGEDNGNTFALQVAGVAKESVKTCEAVSVDVVASPATGYELSNFAVSGVEGVTYSEGVISIPANAEGTLTATATFTKINYTVTMAQTGGASATISGDQTKKNYGDEITVTATAVDGYYFLGWEASPAVTFADAKALETTFTMPNSNVTVTAKFTKILSIAEAADLIDADKSAKHPNSVVEGYIAGNISYNKDYHSITYNIQAIDANGFLSGKTIKVYSGKGLNNKDFASEDDVKVGAKVRVLGELMWYSKEEVYEINYNNYQLSYVEATNPSVVVYGDATKTAYEVGDDFDFTGLSAKTVYDNGYATAIAEPEWTADPETIAANTESVSVTANGSSAKVVNITVNTHAITIEAPENGTLVVKNGEKAIASGDAFAKGTVLTVEATPASADYRLDALTVNGNDIKAAKEFTVGTELKYTVVATFAEKDEAGIEWSSTNGEMQVQGTEIVDSDLPELTNPYELTIAYSSSNTNVAEVNSATGEITPKASGSTKIYATFAGNDDYKAAQVSYDLNVVIDQPKFYVVGPFNSWDEFVPCYDTQYQFENLAPGDYQLKVTTAPNWSEAYGYDALTVKHAGLSKDNEGNICFTIPDVSSGTVIVSFEKDEEGVKTFTVIGQYVKPTFTVVGVEALVGFNWGDGLNVSDNEMVEDLPTENYILVKEDVLLAAGDYEYQVAMNHDWRYGASNSKLTITKSGRYNVTFTYVPSTGATSAEAEPIEYIDILPTMKIAGDWDVDSENSSKWNENELEVASDKLTATYTAKDLVKGTWYHFWIIKNGVYMSGNNEFSRENLSADLTTYYTGAGASAMYFQADKDGDYTFTWTYDTNVITMTFPYKEATALDNTEAGETAVKVMQNGQFFIIKNGKTFNAQGQIIK